MPDAGQKSVSALLIVYILICRVSCSKTLNIVRHISVDKRVLEQNSSIFDIPVLSGCAMICSGKTECLSAVFDEKVRKCYVLSSRLTAIESGEGSLTLLQINEDTYKDCQDAFNHGKTKSGEVYTIKIDGTNRTVNAICEFNDRSGWTVIQRRFNGHVDFYRPWIDYVQGFGDTSGEYWLGLENIYQLTKYNQRVSFYLEKHDGQKSVANYSTFYIDGSQSDYKLHISGFSGDAGDSMSYHNGQGFSAFDRDNDNYDINCALKYKGGWWYTRCYQSNLNGLWSAGGVCPDGDGIIWNSFTGFYNSLKIVTVKITRVP